MVKIIVITCLLGATSMEECGESTSLRKIEFGHDVEMTCTRILDELTTYVKLHGMMLQSFRCLPQPHEG